MRRSWIAMLALSCAPTPKPIAPPAPVPAPVAAPAPAAPADESTFGPLEVGSDYASYRKVTAKPFLSKVHGNRMVEVYVNAIGADAYVSESDVPVGTVVVKTSREDNGAEGPIFVMEKRASGEWWYAIHWAGAPARFGGPVYWRGHSPRVEYCRDCHESYDRGLGGLAPSSVLPR